MNYAELDEEIKKIIELVDKLPEQYRLTAFEVLLKVAAGHSSDPVPDPKPEEKPIAQVQTELPIDVKAFLMQYTLPDEAIDKLFYRKGTEIRPVYKLPDAGKFKGQKQIALLAALENALKGPETKFEFSFEHVRELCKKYGKYDTDNFKGNFAKSKKLFVSLADEEHIELSPDGKAELAELVAELTK